MHPWAWEHYLLDWPKWSSWTASDRASTAICTAEPGQLGAPRWDEFVPQAYRLSYEDFGKDSSWEQLRRSIELTRRQGNGGHVLWYSRGVLDLYARQLKAFYSGGQTVPSPQFPPGWRPAAVALKPRGSSGPGDPTSWVLPENHPQQYVLIGYDGQLREAAVIQSQKDDTVTLAKPYKKVELLVDRRGQLRSALP